MGKEQSKTLLHCFIYALYGSIIYSKVKFKTKKLYHVTTILQTLQEPLVDFRMKFKFCTMVCLALLAFTLANFKFSPSLTQPH